MPHVPKGSSRFQAESFKRAGGATTTIRLMTRSSFFLGPPSNDRGRLRYARLLPFRRRLRHFVRPDATALAEPRESGGIVTKGIVKNGSPFETHSGGNMLKRTFKTALLLGSCLMLATPAFAQSAGEKTGVNSTLGIAPKTTDFVTEAATSDMFEIQSSKLAAGRTTGDVQSFANQMVTDHSKTTEELTGLSKSANIPLPTEMTSSQKSMMDKLNGLQGNDFAKQYMDDQVNAHKDAVSLFDRYGNGGDNAQLKTWAGTTAPVLQHHLDMAQGLYKNT
jgi:putative membrane protein